MSRRIYLFPARGWKPKNSSIFGLRFTYVAFTSSPQGDGNTLSDMIIGSKLPSRIYLFPARGWKRKKVATDKPSLLESHLPLPRKGMETGADKERLLLEDEVAFTSSPQGDGNNRQCIKKKLFFQGRIYLFPARGWKPDDVTRFIFKSIRVAFTSSPQGDGNHLLFYAVVVSLQSRIYLFPARGWKR